VSKEQLVLMLMFALFVPELLLESGFPGSICAW